MHFTNSFSRCIFVMFLQRNQCDTFSNVFVRSKWMGRGRCCYGSVPRVGYLPDDPTGHTDNHQSAKNQTDDEPSKITK